jgi:hypothetical protein
MRPFVFHEAAGVGSGNSSPAPVLHVARAGLDEILPWWKNADAPEWAHDVSRHRAACASCGAWCKSSRHPAWKSYRYPYSPVLCVEALSVASVSLLVKVWRKDIRHFPLIVLLSL